MNLILKLWDIQDITLSAFEPIALTEKKKKKKILNIQDNFHERVPWDFQTLFCIFKV